MNTAPQQLHSAPLAAWLGRRAFYETLLRVGSQPYVKLSPATTRRKRGPSLPRRTGQKGNVYQPAHPGQWNPKTPAYGRFWVDTPDGRKRKTITLGVCRTPSVAKQKLREYLESTGVNSKQTFTTNTAPATTFRQQAEQWIESLSTRRRKPVKPATICGWQQALNAWVLPNIGDRLLSEVSNGVLRELVEKMTAAGLSPKTIVNYAQVVKLVVASAVNEEGEQIQPRNWNHDFIGLPIVDKTKQRQPTITETELGEILSSVKERYAVLFALLAGTGLRIGEALGLKTTDLSPDCRILHVRRSVWRGKEQEPKTPNAIRPVDIPEALARVLRAFVVGKDGYLFATRKGRPLLARNVLRVLQSTGKKVGFHAFRRYRTAVLRKARVPEDLIMLWLGHARNLTDRYATQLREDVAYRTEWAERAGLGFQLGYMGYKNVVGIDQAKVA
jgi:integrase